MTKPSAGPPRPPGLARVESLKIENCRALRSLDHITPITALIGPNGSGKSTIIDGFDFRSECIAIELRRRSPRYHGNTRGPEPWETDVSNR